VATTGRVLDTLVEQSNDLVLLLAVDLVATQEGISTKGYWGVALRYSAHAASISEHDIVRMERDRILWTPLDRKGQLLGVCDLPIPVMGPLATIWNYKGTKIKLG
jgi:hypothetical protein